MWARRSQFQVFIGLSLGAASFIMVLTQARSVSFQKFFGNIHPMIVILTVIMLGGASLRYLESTGRFSIYGGGSLRSLLASSTPAVLMAAVIILVDLVAVLPEDINVLLPESLFFYPAIGYVAEIVFHVLPLSLLLFTLPQISESLSINRVLLPCIVAVSLLEPAFQLWLGGFGDNPLWVNAYSNGIHVLIFNLLQLKLFANRDFASMYTFRIVYYLLWHIAWGYIRLGLLF